ncbi:MAG: peptide-methionine (S)-S-oxide reductase [Cyclobacteriaceae bacterium]|jgi:peptide-methionine (S)-S-oxide reductase
MEKITLGSGCFWCIEAVFQRLNGVESAVSGYSGGKTKDPFYREVVAGKTGHAEVIQVTYDPEIVSLEEVLEVFWKTHDPTTLNSQGHDIGTQYRSVVFYHNEHQKNVAVDIMKLLEDAGIWPDPIVTEISKLDVFYPAENYQQDYFNENRNQPYCQFVVAPKVRKFKEIFADKVKSN